jgi:hypothetical protein
MFLTVDAHPNVADWLTAVGTVSATLLAVVLAGRDQLSRWLFHPRLSVSVRPGPPDSHIVQASEETQMFGRTMQIGTPLYICRLSIDNTGNRRAINVEVRMNRLWRIVGGTKVEDPDFIPLNLVWSNIGSSTLTNLDPGLPRHLDFCHFYQPFGAGEGSASPLTFNTEVEPLEVGQPDPDNTASHRWPTHKEPGEYHAELAITATDVTSLRKVITVAYTGEWFDDAAEIARKALVVTVLG